MKYFNYIRYYFYVTALYLAIEKENIEMVELLLTSDKLDVNIFNIFRIFFIYII